MKIIYVGTAAAPEDLKYYAMLSKKKVAYTQQNWDYSLCKELKERLNGDFFVLSYPPIDSVPNSNRIFVETRPISNIINGQILGTVLVPYVKQFVLLCQLKKEIALLIKKFPTDDFIIITHAIYYQSLKAAYDIKKKHKKIKIFSLVPDMPSFISRTVKNRFIINHYNQRCMQLSNNLDGYVCFSEDQMEDLNTSKPFIVLNGFIDQSILSAFSFDSPSSEESVKKDERIKLLYAGHISKDMGIDRLVEAFLSLNDNRARLYLCGNGDYVKELKDLKDERVVYLGVLPRESVLLLERSSDLLLNPRLIDEEFSRKSFPSKTFEYMVSGVPILSSHLKCFSKEYDEHMVYFENNTFEEYVAKIRYCIDNIASLKEKAVKTREYVVREKNIKNYCDQLLRFVGVNNDN